MEGGPLSKDKIFWYYLDHFERGQLCKIERLRELVDEENLLEGPRLVNYNAQFLDSIFQNGMTVINYAPGWPAGNARVD